MVRLYEVLKDIMPLTYTGYYVEVPSLSCIKDYGHNYIAKHADLKKRRLTNPEQYDYVAEATASPTPSCHDISDANGFITCLSSCGSDCSVTLQSNAMITLTNSITTNLIYPGKNLTIRANEAYFTNGVSNEEWTGIIVDSIPISLKSLDICGVNLSVYNHKSLSPALQCTSGLIIREGTHSFYNNSNNMGDSSGGAIKANDISLIDTNIIFRQNHSNTAGGAIYSGNDINMIDASIIFKQNHSIRGGAIYAQNSLTISGDRTNILFLDNSAYSMGGAIYSGNDINIEYINNNNKIMFYHNNSLTGGAIYTYKQIRIQNVYGGGLDFYGNSARDFQLGLGGAICSLSGTHLIDASITFRQNYSNMAGGAIYSNNLLTISGDKTNIKLYDNSVNSTWNFSSGAINTTTLVISSGVLDFCGNRILIWGDLLDNSRGGGAMTAYYISLIDASITFRHNYSNQDGGAIYVQNFLTISGENTNLIFHDNSAQHGGAIYMYVDSSLRIQHDLSTSKFSFQNNKTDDIYFDENSTITQCPPLDISCNSKFPHQQCNDLSSGKASCGLTTQEECNAWYNLVDAWDLTNPSYGLCHDIRNNPCDCSSPIWNSSSPYPAGCTNNNITDFTIGELSISGNLRYLSGLTYLQNLLLQYMPNISGNLSDLSGLSKLEDLYLVNMSNIRSNLSDLSGKNQLIYLHLKNLPNISGNLRDLSGLKQLTNLELLDISNISGNLSDLSTPYLINSLQSLNLSDMSRISGDLSGLSYLNRLENLSLKNISSISGNLSDLSTPYLINSLKYLNLVDMSRISGGLSSLSDLSNLLSLTLINMQNISGTLIDLSNLNVLNALHLQNMSRISGGLSSLSDLRNLTLIDMQNISGTLIDLSNLNVLNALHLQNMSSISGNLSSLSHLKNLKYLDIYGSGKLDGSCQDISNILNALNTGGCTLTNLSSSTYTDCYNHFNSLCDFSTN